MKSIILSIFLLFSGSIFAHDYYFAFAEVEYNDISQRIETTLIVSTHDLEKVMCFQYVDYADVFEDISTIKSGTKEEKLLENYLLKHFKISSITPCILNMIGFEVQLNGLTYFYFESESFNVDKEIKFIFDLFMDKFESQQNKITFLYQNKTYTRPFLKDEKEQIIKL